MDALIAAIAREASATVATRDLDAFADLGLDLVDPWAFCRRRSSASRQR